MKIKTNSNMDYVEQESLPPQKPLQDPDLRNGLKARRLLSGTELRETTLIGWIDLQGNPSDNDELLALLENFQTSLGYTPMRGSNNLSEIDDPFAAFNNLGLNVGGLNDWFVRKDGSRMTEPLEIDAEYPLILLPNAVPVGVEEGAFEFDGKQVYFTPSTVRKAISLNSDVLIASPTVVNTLVETELFAADVTADTFGEGQIFRVILLGKYSVANGADSCTLRFKVNGSTVFTLVTELGAVTDAPISITITNTIRTDGSTGSFWSYLEAVLNNVNLHQTLTSTEAIDTTVDNTFQVTAEWDNNLAGNTISIDQGLLNAS